MGKRSRLINERRNLRLEEKAKDHELVDGICRRIVEKFCQNPKQMYSSVNELKSAVFAAKEKEVTDWSVRKLCSFLDCPATAINNSHGIARGMLESICEKQHVFTPALFDDGTIGMTKIGVKKASTFPGFCKTHENFFASFEAIKSLQSENEVYKQVYRSAVREHHRAKHWINQLDSAMTAYEERRNKHLLSEANKELASCRHRPLRGWQNKVIDSAQHDLLVRREKLQILKSLLEEDLLPGLMSMANAAGETPKLYVRHLEIEENLAVALSGPGEIYSNEHSIRMILGIIPEDKKTTVFLAGSLAHENELDTYWTNATVSRSGILDMINRWLISGTDQWYISPLKWKEFTDHNKREILRALTVSKDDMLCAPDVKII